MCVANVYQRLGRSALTFVCIAVVVAFFASSMGYQRIVTRLAQTADIHVQAVLERADVISRDAQGAASRHDQQIWLLVLSAGLCLVGITNTILMSVTERFREIGTLKCLGALDSFVVRLFLIENAFIGALASFLGALAGVLLALLQAGAALEFALLDLSVCFNAFAYSMPRAIALGTVLTILASLYPTYVASRMRPVDAMRVDI